MGCERVHSSPGKALRWSASNSNGLLALQSVYDSGLLNVHVGTVADLFVLVLSPPVYLAFVGQSQDVGSAKTYGYDTLGLEGFNRFGNSDVLFGGMAKFPSFTLKSQKNVIFKVLKVYTVCNFLFN